MNVLAYRPAKGTPMGETGSLGLSDTVSNFCEKIPTRYTFKGPRRDSFGGYGRASKASKKITAAYSFEMYGALLPAPWVAFTT